MTHHFHPNCCKIPFRQRPILYSDLPWQQSISISVLYKIWMKWSTNKYSVCTKAWYILFLCCCPWTMKTHISKPHYCNGWHVTDTHTIPQLVCTDEHIHRQTQVHKQDWTHTHSPHVYPLEGRTPGFLSHVVSVWPATSRPSPSLSSPITNSLLTLVVSVASGAWLLRSFLPPFLPGDVRLTRAGRGVIWPIAS